MKDISIKLFLTKLLCLVLVSSCGQDDFGSFDLNEGGNANEPPQNSQSMYSSISMEVSGLEELKGQHYEGWIIENGEAISTGRFNFSNGQLVLVNVNGEVDRVLSGTVMETSMSIGSGATAFVLTIEPNGDPSPAPSQVHILGADLNSNVVVATADHGAAIGDDFSRSYGSYILATPSNGPTTHNQGIWWLNPANGTGALSLPELPAGWQYEGWVVNPDEGTVISTGTFFHANQPDSDRAGGVKAGPLNSGPDVPGQDFINPALVLNDGHHAAVITVEPFPDFDPAPSQLKILKADIRENANVMQGYAMDNISEDHVPQMTVQLRE